MSTNLYPCVWTLLLCMVAPAGATAQTVYFSAGKEILKLELTSAGTTLVHT